MGLFSEIGLELDYHGAKALFDLFDKDGDGNIDVNEFIQGMSLYGGSAKSVVMCHHFQRLHKKINEALRMTRATENLLARWEEEQRPVTEELLRGPLVDEQA